MTPELNLSRDPAHLRHGSTIGQPLSRIDGLAKVTGRARDAADNNPSGMLYAVLAGVKHRLALRCRAGQQMQRLQRDLAPAGRAFDLDHRIER
ncbi:hypothetical protein, partial [Bradyrhizobium sp.]|uniref:hypothetical protein n=1 Tax=Bradyrhizobium sp. TaxID=376 RepID=UPI0039191DEE